MTFFGFDPSKPLSQKPLRCQFFRRGGAGGVWEGNPLDSFDLKKNIIFFGPESISACLGHLLQALVHFMQFLPCYESIFGGFKDPVVPVSRDRIGYVVATNGKMQEDILAAHSPALEMAMACLKGGPSLPALKRKALRVRPHKQAQRRLMPTNTSAGSMEAA